QASGTPEHHSDRGPTAARCPDPSQDALPAVMEATSRCTGRSSHPLPSAFIQVREVSVISAPPASTPGTTCTRLSRRPYPVEAPCRARRTTPATLPPSPPALALAPRGAAPGRHARPRPRLRRRRLFEPVLRAPPRPTDTPSPSLPAPFPPA